jgi:hypothetical protein
VVTAASVETRSFESWIPAARGFSSSNQTGTGTGVTVEVRVCVKEQAALVLSAFPAGTWVRERHLQVFMSTGTGCGLNFMPRTDCPGDVGLRSAGHCVCDERKSASPEAPDITIVDKRARCAATARVRILAYRPQADLSGDDDSVPADESEPYKGTVEVHGDIRIVYREVETEPGKTVRATLFSNADLAVIFLKDAPKEVVKYVPLAKARVERKEKVILAGYGLPYLGGDIGRDRRYGENYVVSTRTDGTTFQVGKQDVEVAEAYSGEAPDARVKSGASLTSGDSGGPCFRKVGDGIELVGIAKSVRAGTVTLSAYTSTLMYLDWLKQKIEESRKAYSN